MVLTLELPVRPADPLATYERRFGALPPWVDDLPATAAAALARLALRRGAPLAAADALF